MKTIIIIAVIAVLAVSAGVWAECDIVTYGDPVEHHIGIGVTKTEEWFELGDDGEYHSVFPKNAEARIAKLEEMIAMPRPIEDQPFAYQCSNCDRIEYWTSHIDPKLMGCTKCHYDEDVEYHMSYLGNLAGGNLWIVGKITSDKPETPLIVNTKLTLSNASAIAKLEAELRRVAALMYTIHDSGYAKHCERVIFEPIFSRDIDECLANVTIEEEKEWQR